MFTKIKSLFTKQPAALQKDWKNIEYFDESWKNRLKEMATYIPANTTVLDLGCGPMWIKEFITHKKYYPVDYKKRSDDTIICDFNKHEFPDLNVDYTVVSGCLEYVEDYKWFIKQISVHSGACVISYCCTDVIKDINARKGLAWVNHLSKEQLIACFAEYGMSLASENNNIKGNFIFLFTHKAKA